MNVDDMPELQRLTLEKLRFKGRMVMSNEAVAEMTVDMVADMMSDSFVANMGGFVWQNQIHRQTRKLTLPLTWWDSFKTAHLPEWLNRRMPVRTYEIDTSTEFIHTCPHLPISSRDDMRMHMEWMMPPAHQMGTWG